MFLAAFFVSFSAIFIRLSDAPALAIAAWRMGFAAAMMGPILVVSRERGRRRPVEVDGGLTGRSDQRFLKQSRFASALAVIASGVFLAAHFGTWITSLSMTSVIHSTVLVTMHPVFVIVASGILLRERVPRGAIVGAFTAMGGAVLLSLGGSAAGTEPTAAGNFLALFGAIAVTGYMIVGRWARRSMGAASYNATVYLVAAVVLLPAAFAMGQSLGPFPLREYLIFAALALVCTILGHGVFNWALRFVPALEISTAVLLEPVFASIMAAVLFGEIPGLRTVAGAVVILGSVAMVLYHNSREDV